MNTASRAADATGASQLPAIWADNALQVLYNFVPIVVGTLLVSLLLALLTRRAAGKSFGEMLIFISPFGWIGGVCGFIAGSSQEPLIGALVTGMLAVATTLLPLVFGKEAESAWRGILPVAITLLFICVLIGITAGKVHKSRWDSFDRDYAKWKLGYEQVTIPTRSVLARHKLCKDRITSANLAQCDKILLPEE